MKSGSGVKRELIRYFLDVMDKCGEVRWGNAGELGGGTIRTEHST